MPRHDPYAITVHCDAQRPGCLVKFDAGRIETAVETIEAAGWHGVPRRGARDVWRCPECSKPVPLYNGPTLHSRATHVEGRVETCACMACEKLRYERNPLPPVPMPGVNDDDEEPIVF